MGLSSETPAPAAIAETLVSFLMRASCLKERTSGVYRFSLMPQGPGSEALSVLSCPTREKPSVHRLEGCWS